MKVTVWSALSGKVSGHLVMSVPGTHTVKKLLETYCKHKDVVPDGYVMRSRDNLLLNPNKTLEQASIDDGETLTLSLADDEEQTFAFGSWRMVSIAAFLIGSIGLALSIYSYVKPLPSPEKYGIVMDAGSSHSEIFLFTWNGEKPLGTADVTLVHRCFMAGGVSSFVGHVDDLGGYLDNCLRETKAHFPHTSHSGTPYYVGATAGMRILRDFDPEGAKLILSTLREVLRTKTPFLIVHDNIDIIKGSEEGASGWTAVNYLLGHLKKDEEPTAAAFDVGGASIQISRVIDNGTWTPENLTLFKHNYPILSQSFLCYGIGEAQHRYDYFLVNENKTVEEDKDIVDPCLAKDITHNITTGDLNGPCTRTDDSKPVLIGMSKIKWHKLKRIFKNLQGSEVTKNLQEREVTDGEAKVPPAIITNEENVGDDELPGITIYTHGSSNATECDQKLKKLFDVKLCKSTFTYGDCMDAKAVPVLTGDLVAFSSLFQQLMQVLELKPGTSLQDFKSIVFEVCSLTAEELYERFPEPKEIVEDLCFDSMYLYNLMTTGLGIDSSEWRKIQFTDEINKTEIEWPMGFMMNRTTPFAADIPSRPLSVAAYLLLLLLFAAFIMSGVMFCWHSVKIKKSTSYQRCGPHQA